MQVLCSGFLHLVVYSFSSYTHCSNFSSTFSLVQPTTEELIIDLARVLLLR